MPRQFDRERTRLAQTLITLRHKHGNVSQKELSRLTDGAVSDGHIAQIETGDRGASRATLEAISLALQLEPEDEQALLRAAALDAGLAETHYGETHLYSGPDVERRLTLIEERLARLEAAIDRHAADPGEP